MGRVLGVVGRVVTDEAARREGLSIRSRVDCRLPDSEEAVEFQTVVFLLESGLRDRAEEWYLARVAGRCGRELGEVG